MNYTLVVSKRSQGVAMVAALGLMAVASAVMLLLFMRTMDELQHGRDDTAIVQTLLVAQGGANLGVALLHGDVADALDQIATDRSEHSGPWSFGPYDADRLVPDPAGVASRLAGVAASLQVRIDALVCGERTLADGTVLNLRVHVTDKACDEPLPDDTRLGDGHFVSGSRRELGGNQTYALPFVMVSDGSVGEFRRRVVTQGEYQFEVGRRSFARYALFTDGHSPKNSSNGRIWFTSDTLFDGPVHTNGNFSFAERPWFGGAVSSAGENNNGKQGAYGYGGSRNDEFFGAKGLQSQGNYPKLSTSGSTNRPEFAGGVDWRAKDLPLPENAYEQREIAGEDGILIEECVRDLLLFAGDSSGNPVEAGEDSTYQYVPAELGDQSQGRCDPGKNWRHVTWRIAPDGEMHRLVSGIGTWQKVSDKFNGVIYADDNIERLRAPDRKSANDPMSARPALASFSQITIVPAAGARITSNLVYEDQPCSGHLHRKNGKVVRAKCENLEAINVLGIFSPTASIQIGHCEPWKNSSTCNAPRDVRIQASLMTSLGVVEVENYDSVGTGRRGEVRLLGGIIEKNYGAFGTFGGQNGDTGYGRQFTFDPRMGRGLTPPYFPLVGIDGVHDVRTFTYGHREQVY